MIAVTYPLFDVFVSTLYFAILIAWVILVFHVFQDIMRSHDLTGAAKAVWVLFVLVVPLLGCVLYLIVRGGAMHLRQERVQRLQRDAFEKYIRDVVSRDDAEESKVPTP